MKVEIYKNRYNDTEFITGLRALAVLMVFMIHVLQQTKYVFNDYLDYVINSFSSGVIIFFVISGFTIYSQFSKGTSVSQFLKVRLSRICIPYYPLILIVWFCMCVQLVPTSMWAKELSGFITTADLITHLTFMGMFNERYINSILRVEWSLYVEVFYYLIFAICILLLQKTKSVIFVIFFVITLFYFLFKLGVGEIDKSPVHFVGYFLLGFWSGFIRMKFQKVRKHISDFLFISLAVAVMASPILELNVNYISGIITAGLIVFGGRSDDFFNRLMNHSSLFFLGKISYSFYLTHLLVIGFLKFAGMDGIILVPVALVSSVLVASTYYYIFELKIYGRIRKTI
ncbi:acyltransferase [Vibrio parahaemolyticus]|nr:acyltransferase [Vibrio parahaemolyticus]